MKNLIGRIVDFARIQNGVFYEVRGSPEWCDAFGVSEERALNGSAKSSKQTHPKNWDSRPEMTKRSQIIEQNPTILL